jgi:hypothetical protein
MLVPEDLSVPADLSTPEDLRAPDMSVAIQDLAMTRDASAARDQSIATDARGIDDLSVVAPVDSGDGMPPASCTCRLAVGRPARGSTHALLALCVVAFGLLARRRIRD